MSCLFASTLAHILLLSEGFAGLHMADAGKGQVLNVRISSLAAPKISPPELPVSGGTAASLPPIGASPARSATVVPSAGESSIFIPPVENYLPVSMLTEAPSPIDSVDPTPAGFKFDGLVGELELLLLISSDGDVDAVLTVRSSLPESFAEYAKLAFKEARFSPGRIQKTAVRSRVRIVLSPPPLSIDPETGHPLSAKNRRR